MRKYTRKCKAIGDIGVMEMSQVGVRMTRAPTALAVEAESSGTGKRRKLTADGELSFTSSLVRLRNTRPPVLITQENSVSPASSGNSLQWTAVKDPCESPCSDAIPASCCSSNGSSELANGSSKILDLEDVIVEVHTSEYNLDHGESKSQTESSGERQSTARETNANSCSRPAVEKMPSEGELEEFFVAAEKDLRKRFADKYNYDIGEDTPLEGRYEWVRIKP